MTDETITETLSTLISEAPNVAAGGGDPPPDTGDENLSIEEVLRKEARAQDEAAKEARKAEKAAKEEAVKAEVKAEEAKPKVEKAPEKAEAEEDPSEDAEDVEALKKGRDDAGERETAKAAQSEGKADRIPSRLLPKEREVWANVPNAVKAAWERMEREHTEAAQKYEPAVRMHEELREFDELARKSGTTVKAALANYVNAENALRQDFGRGVTQLANTMGKNPTQAVAEFMRAAGVSPQQLGAYLQGQPAQPAQQQPAQQAQRAPDPVAQQALQEVAQLKQMLAQQQAEAQKSQVVNDVITPFAQSHPRFEELGPDIAFFLNSGKIPTSLSPVERLEVAYDMAERINPAPIAPQTNLAEPAGKPPVSDAGKKSVRGAPASGQSLETDFDDETDLVTLLRREARKMTA